MTAQKRIVLDDAPQVELSNYNIHKSLYSQMPAMKEETFQKNMVSIGGWFSTNPKCKFFMLMCKEISYYTVFYLENPNYSKAVEELARTLKLRGEIIDINYVHSENAYECWVRNSQGEVNMYYLFEYDWGVIDIH